MGCFVCVCVCVCVSLQYALLRAWFIPVQEYLESFYHFCQSIGGATAEVMGGILEVCSTIHGALVCDSCAV